MFSSTHKLISYKVYEAVKAHLDVTLDYKSLGFGSIAPDINPFMMFIPHCKDGSADFIERSIDRLAAGKIPENKVSV